MTSIGQEKKKMSIGHVGNLSRHTKGIVGAQYGHVSSSSWGTLGAQLGHERVKCQKKICFKSPNYQ